MPRNHTAEEVRRFDIGKLIVLIILIILLLLSWFRTRGQPQQPLVEAPAAVATAVSEDVATDVPEGVAPVEIALPVIDAPDGSVPAGEVVLTGAGEPRRQVAVLVDDQPVGTAEVGSDGTWVLPVELAAGERQIVVQTLNDGGEIVNAAEAVTFTVAEPAGVAEPDLTVPEIAPPAEDVPAGEFTLTGVGTPGRQVAILVDGVQVGTAAVGDDGTWSLPVELAGGSQEVVVQTLGDDGEVLNESEPLMISVLDPSSPVVTAPEETLEAGIVTLTGTAAPGVELEIVINDEVVGTTTAGDSGTWSLDMELAAGEYEVQAQTLDDAGSAALSSEVVALVVGEAAEAESGETEGTVLEAAEAEGTFTTFLELVDSAELRETLDGEGPFTIFAPTDEAFADLPQNVQDAILSMPPALLATVLQAHMVEGTLTAEDVAAADTLETLTGDELSVSSDGTAVKLDGATLLGPEIVASNGVIHPIDRVLLPSPLAPADIRAPMIDDSGVPTFECCALTVVGNAQPGTEIVLLANGEQYGETATVDEDGFWFVPGEVVVGDYDLVALMFGEDGNLLGVSPRVFLAVTE